MNLLPSATLSTILTTRDLETFGEDFLADAGFEYARVALSEALSACSDHLPQILDLFREDVFAMNHHARIGVIGELDSIGRHVLGESFPRTDDESLGPVLDVVDDLRLLGEDGSFLVTRWLANLAWRGSGSGMLHGVDYDLAEETLAAETAFVVVALACRSLTDPYDAIGDYLSYC